jgi:hypothetical protein
MNEQMTSAEQAALSQGQPHHAMRDLHNRWLSETKFQGDVFPDYRPYDPRLLGDTPSHFFSLHDTQIIRTPAVTKDAERTFFGTLTRASIVEEFEGFLSHYERQNKSHLYVNLMAPIGSEKIRIEALEELERKKPALFLLVTLSKDCQFYHQAGRFAAQSDAGSFKETFLKQMFGGNPAYHWPLSWDSAQVRELCSAAIEKVHAEKFNSAHLLSQEQRCRFIELAYTEILEKIIRDKRPATCNISCRSCVDRGAVNLSLLYAKTQPLNTAESRSTLAAIALAPAILAQSRPMLLHRMDRLQGAMEQLSFVFPTAEC